LATQACASTIAEVYGVIGMEVALDLARDVFKAMWEQKNKDPERN